MKKLLTLFLIICAHAVPAQRLQHHFYAASYHAGLKTCDSVSWDLTPDMVNCPNPISRRVVKDDFEPDPMLGSYSPLPKDYAVNHRGTPRPQWINLGHLFNAKDAACYAEYYKECFLMSNMLPQYEGFNTGDWKTLEGREQVMAGTQRIHILAGRIGAIGNLPSGESVPAYMYKAIYHDGRWEVWIMKNDPTSSGHTISTKPGKPI